MYRVREDEDHIRKVNVLFTTGRWTKKGGKRERLVEGNHQIYIERGGGSKEKKNERKGREE